MSINISSYKVANEFVCVNDIKGLFKAGVPNPVIYNKALTPKQNKAIVKKFVMERFNVLLSSKQLSELCDTGLTSDLFISKLQHMI